MNNLMNSNSAAISLNEDVVNTYIRRYQLSTKNAIENILNMGEAVFEVYTKNKAKELTDDDLKYFCTAVNLDIKSSTFRKYKAIGQNANRFREVMDKLPATFSVLYEMATLSGDDFERLVMNKSYTKAITLDHFKKMMHKSVVLARNKMINKPAVYFSPSSMYKAIKEINKFNISIMRDVPKSKYEEIVGLLTEYRNEGFISFDDPQITEYGATHEDAIGYDKKIFDVCDEIEQFEMVN